jgi:hypothetical protein
MKGLSFGRGLSGGRNEEAGRAERRSQKAREAGWSLAITAHFSWLAKQKKLDRSAKMNSCTATRPLRSLSSSPVSLCKIAAHCFSSFLNIVDKDAVGCLP